MLEVEATVDLSLPDGRPVGMTNLSSVSSGEIANDPQVRHLMSQLGSWVEQSRSYGRLNSRSNMFDRQLYIAPDNPYEGMRVARIAMSEDDIVSGVADATEALAFHGGLKWESSDPDEADIFNQLSADLNLDGKIREMWRDLFCIDQFICAKTWDQAQYTVRGETDQGNKKKKKFDVYVPAKLTILNSTRIVPVGYGPLRDDNLAWQATPNEIADYRVSMSTFEPLDPLMSVFFTGEYVPKPDERVELADLGVDCDQLLSINPKWVFRHTTTRPDYQRFPDLRMRSVFGLLDLKRQLVASDRAMLIGAANYILLIRKGSDNAPATQEEVTNLKANYNFLAKLPVIISDNRLQIDIIAPKLDFVLKKDAYEALDLRILNRVLSSFAAPGRTSTDSTSTFSDTLAAVIQSRRHMLKRTLEYEIGRAVVDHPKNAGKFQTRPSLVFTPRTVSIGTNQPALQALLALRTQREVSRDTILEYMGLDQSTEAQRLEFEKKVYDDIFKTQIPFAAPGSGGAPGGGVNAPEAKAPVAKTQSTPNGTPVSPSVNGTRGGGRPKGGGSSTASPANAAKPKTANGNSSTKASEEDLND
jgi:hypothetical protein